jgi:hypothetical protein
VKINLLREPATPEQVAEMLEELQTYIKLAVDIKRGIAAGGGEWHADCEQALLSAGSRQEDIWGADWSPSTHQVTFEAFINIRPRQNNRGMQIQNPELRKQVEAIVRHLFE